jgi:OOP family OmpA-OmpF porin
VRTVPVIVFASALVFGGCATPPPKTKYSEKVILLPNKDGRMSAVIVKRASGEYQIATPYHSIELVAGQDREKDYEPEDVGKRYGEVLEAQPARPFTYTLYFVTAMTQLAPQSAASLNDVKQKIKSFPAAQVTVIGHTDRVGNDTDNDVLSLKRAVVVRDMLVQIGIPREAVEVVGRGEREPLVQTADGVAEDRNRRVEIKLR